MPVLLQESEEPLEAPFSHLKVENRISNHSGCWKAQITSPGYLTLSSCPICKLAHLTVRVSKQTSDPQPLTKT